MTCRECEDGSCPCGTGCEDCQNTTVCRECHGTQRVEMRLVDTITSGGRRHCRTCGRKTQVLDAPPDYEHLRTRRPAVYAKMMSIERCTACHSPFQVPGARAFGYRLLEAS